MWYFRREKENCHLKPTEQIFTCKCKKHEAAEFSVRWTGAKLPGFVS